MIEHPLGRVAQVHVSVTDLDASVAFYRDVLGLTHLFTVQGQPMAFFDAGGVRIYLGAEEDERFRSRPTIYYTVDDLDATHAAVLRRGAPELASPHRVHVDETGELWMSAVADPDQTPVVLMEQRPGG